jgi:hypothetical protein
MDASIFFTAASVPKEWITAAVENIDAPMLTRVWQEFEYHIQ